jgi:ABC-type amino acid transport substrate-binding protein
MARNHVNRTAVFFLAIALISAPSISPSRASEDASPVCVVSPNVTDVGNLVIGASNQNVPTIEWGIRQGCFKKYGLSIKALSVASFPVGIAGLVSKSYDLYATTPVNVIKSVAEGIFPGRFVAAKHGYSESDLLRAKTAPLYPDELLMSTAVVVSKRSGIKTLPDLNGKKVAVLSTQGVDQAGIILALREAGIRKPKIEFLVLSNVQMADALKRGDVDAAVAIDPFATQMIKDGGEVIGYPQAYFQEPGPAIVFMSSAEIVKSKSRAIRAFQKANLEINRLLNKKENEKSLRAVISEVTKVSPDVASKVKLSTMSESDLTISQLSYLPNKLKRVGFMKGRFEIGPIIFR